MYNYVDMLYHLVHPGIPGIPGILGRDVISLGPGNSGIPGNPGILGRDVRSLGPVEFQEEMLYHSALGIPEFREILEIDVGIVYHMGHL